MAQESFFLASTGSASLTKCLNTCLTLKFVIKSPNFSMATYRTEAQQRTGVSFKQSLKTFEFRKTLPGKLFNLVDRFNIGCYMI